MAGVFEKGKGRRGSIFSKAVSSTKAIFDKLPSAKTVASGIREGAQVAKDAAAIASLVGPLLA